MSKQGMKRPGSGKDASSNVSTESNKKNNNQKKS